MASFNPFKSRTNRAPNIVREGFTDIDYFKLLSQGSSLAGEGAELTDPGDPRQLRVDPEQHSKLDGSDRRFVGTDVIQGLLAAFQNRLKDIRQRRLHPGRQQLMAQPKQLLKTETNQ